MKLETGLLTLIKFQIYQEYWQFTTYMLIGLVFSNGEKWASHRKALMPLFSPTFLKKYVMFCNLSFIFSLFRILLCKVINFIWAFSYPSSLLSYKCISTHTHTRSFYLFSSMLYFLTHSFIYRYIPSFDKHTVRFIDIHTESIKESFDLRKNLITIT